MLWQLLHAHLLALLVTGDGACWSGAFSFESCCRITANGHQGNPACWDGDFSYGKCCAGEVEARLAGGLAKIGGGAHRAASHELLDLHVNYVDAAQRDGRTARESWQGFEKAAMEYQRELDALPGQLSYFEVLFWGLHERCPAPEGHSSNALSDFERCCSKALPDRAGCRQVREMLAVALARRQRLGEGGEDAYFRDFSQHWAFHHFTPSLLLSTDVLPEDPHKSYEEAFAMDAAVAEALTREAEPRLGIVWSELVAEYRSPKFLYGTLFLTAALSAVREAHPGRPVDAFEIGAGYGALPWMLAGARQRLLELQPALDVQSYNIFDLKAINELQAWYLRKTANVEVREDWPTEGGGGIWADRGRDAALPVNLVDRDRRDLVSHLYGRERGPRAGQQRVRLLIAVNSWHEMPMEEYLWYFNEFVDGRRLAADWLLYVSNVEWYSNEAKERLLLGPESGLQVHWQRCAGINCARLLRRKSG